MHVSISVYIQVLMHVSVSVCVHVSVYVFVCMCVHICVCVSLYLCGVQVCIYLCDTRGRTRVLLILLGKQHL